jgi:translation elongation factor EF-Tu-like GTPase
MLTGAAQMEGAILVVAVMMVPRYKLVNMLFYQKRLVYLILLFILIIRF